MIAADVGRAALLVVMAVPGMPLLALCVLLVGVQLKSLVKEDCRSTDDPSGLRQNGMTPRFRGTMSE